MPMFIAPPAVIVYRGASPRRTPQHARSRGPPCPAPLAWLVRSRSLVSSHVLQDARSLHRLADDDAFRPRDAGERAELRVAALDQLPERRSAQAGGDRAPACRLELGAVARQRFALALVVGGNVHDERRRDAVVDEVVADPVG